MRTYISAALSAAFLVLLAVLVPVSALSAWVHLEIDDTDRYVAAVAPLASDPDVQNTVSDLITDEAMKQIDVGPLQDTVRDFLHQAVRSFTTTDAFQAAWNAANRTAHQAVTAALDGESGESVTIDLAPVTEKVKQNLVDNGVPFADQIPVQHTDIQIVSADRADQMRQSFRWLRAAGVWPAVGTVVFAALVVLLAWVRGGPGRRRSAVAALTATAVAGAGFALSALVLRGAIALARNRVLAEVPGSETDGAAAVYDALTGSLRTTVWIVLGTGLAVAVCATAARIRARARHVPPAPPGA
ncbi:hypothetical protein E6R60_13075 [Streptomyces sp. A0642]|uniref:hypothetical protein n=1 Tax=Streptomyces sp. A0642 TaxID=2563100 RepID=UPI0010A21A50|nr:hypothetical protein [Streptomyces sp. A0642]THA76525.1 hypothetical protein E6R60_13075 [Streptomyces sp. A0642]